MDIKSSYTKSELMVTAAAREISEGEVVFVGMRLPLLGFLLAKSLHALGAVGIYELGIIRESLAPAPILTMGDLPNLYMSHWLADTFDTMSIHQAGLVDVSFIGGAQVDRYGNLNTTVTGKSLKTRLPGSGGACDLASLAGRHIIIMAHEKRRFVSKVDYITSPGYGNGKGWREKVGLVRGGPSAVITTLGIFRFDQESCEMILSSVHPGVTLNDIHKETGWSIRVSNKLSETPEPTPKELDILRQLDYQGYWTGK